jgi:hypothetical protein
VSMPNGGQELAPTENVGRGFILRSTLPTERTLSQPHYMEVPVQGIMPGEKSSNHSGLLPTKGQEPDPVTPIRPRDDWLISSKPVTGTFHLSICLNVNDTERDPGR